MFLTTLIDLIGFGIVIPVLPLYADRFHAGAFEIGALMGVFSACQFLFAPFFGRWSDRVGRRPVLIISMIGNVAGYLVMAFGDSLAMLFVARIIAGVSGSSISTAQAAMADVTPVQERAKGMGLVGAAFGLGFMIGPMLGGLLSPLGAGAPFMFAALLAALNVWLITVRFPETLPMGATPAGHEDRSAVDANAAHPLRMAILAFFLLITGFSILTAMFSLFTKQRLGFGEWENGLIFGYIGFIAVLIQGGLVGRLAPRFGDKPLLAAGALLTTAGLVLLPFVTTLWPLLGVCFLLSAGNSLMSPVLNAMASKLAGPQHQGRVLGLMQSAGSLARFLGPFAGGALFTVTALAALPAQWAFWTGAVLVFLSGVLALSVRQPAVRESV